MHRIPRILCSSAWKGKHRIGVLGNYSTTSLLFDDTQKQFKESVSQFAQDKIAPHAAKVDATNNFPKVARPCHFSAYFFLVNILVWSLRCSSLLGC
ncbi:hypothetical protein EJ110_NYTH55873 [Nymphaea thermarum]|nr:hypothetical protein EJ110_NYTH55873 [Nymphaea thermarum]